LQLEQFCAMRWSKRKGILLYLNKDTIFIIYNAK
jgi:hypothetical protein